MTMTLSRHRAARAFTLIELLVVVTIIGLLAGLAFPAIAGAITAAKKAEASAMNNQLRTALTAYQTEYGTWPDALTDAGTSTTDGREDSGKKELYETLIAKKTGTNYPDDNTRGIVFMEFNAKVLRKGAISATNKTPPAVPSEATGFVDPWSQPYRIVADTNYDGELLVPGDAGADVTINAALAIWSRGPQKVWDAEVDPKKNFVRSWR